MPGIGSATAPWWCELAPDLPGREFHENAGSADKTLKLYEGHFHDLLNDLGKEQVLAEILAWINARN
jgi:alpha-beta hydrolase superfamily lysophospholipase